MMMSYKSLAMLSSLIVYIGVRPVDCGRQKNSQVDQALACGKPTTKIGRAVHYGTCICNNKNHPENTKCVMKDTSPDNEEKWRPGACKNGVCQLKALTKDCENVPTIPTGSSPPLGCAFFCDQRKGKYGYFPLGTKCQHKIPPKTYVNGTCQQSGEKVICSEVQLPPAC